MREGLLFWKILKMDLEKIWASQGYGNSDFLRDRRLQTLRLRSRSLLRVPKPIRNEHFSEEQPYAVFYNVLCPFWGQKMRLFGGSRQGSRYGTNRKMEGKMSEHVSRRRNERFWKKWTFRVDETRGHKTGTPAHTNLRVLGHSARTPPV